MFWDAHLNGKIMKESKETMNDGSQESDSARVRDRVVMGKVWGRSEVGPGW